MGLGVGAAILFSVVFLLDGSLVAGQTCQPWSGKPDYCGQYQEYKAGVPIYVPPERTLEFMETWMVSAVNQLGSLVLTPQQDVCRQRALRLLCSTWLRPCAAEDLPIPIQPCYSACDEFLYKTACNNGTIEPSDEDKVVGTGLYFPPGYAPPLTCSEMEQNGEPFYQEEEYIATLEGREYNLHCNKMQGNDSKIPCEAPLENANDLQCAFTCPLQSYSEEQYDSLKAIQLAFGWLSWLGSLLVILSYLLHPKLRLFPSNLILMTALAANIATLAIILPTFAGYTVTWCGADTQYLIPDNRLSGGFLTIQFSVESLSVESSLCTFQGWLLQFGFLSSTAWWGIVGFNMFLSIYFGDKLPNSTSWKVGLQLTYHACGWVIPAILSLIPAAAGSVVFAPGASFCEVASMENLGYFLACWAIPVGLVLFAGTVLFLCTIFRLLHHSYMANDLKKAVEMYLRLVLFILIYLCLFAFIFSFTLRLASDKEAIEEGYSDYFLCLVVRLEECSLPSGVHNFPLAVLKGLGYSCLGLCLCLNFCTSRAILRLWARTFINVSHGRWASSNNGSSSIRSKKKKSGTEDVMTMTMANDDDDEEGSE
ncbi:hypothetical protein QOT17_018180 [Balamuthia mandrillaris]